jgi:hypothetical protein
MPRKYKEDEWETAFWARVDKTSDTQGCWLWTGNKCPSGYGSLKWKGKTHNSHKVSYLLTGQVIPEGYYICHSEHCVGKRHCCNPGHLTAKPPSENNMDQWRDGTKYHKLTNQQVLDIRARVGQTHKEIAAEFGVSRGLVSMLIRGETRTHI